MFRCSIRIKYQEELYNLFLTVTVGGLMPTELRGIAKSLLALAVLRR